MTQLTESQIHTLAKTLNKALIKFGIKGMMSVYEPTKRVVPATFVKDAFNAIGLNIVTTMQDRKYTLTDWKIMDDVLDVITDISKEFKWTREVYDCDNRAGFVKTMCDLMTGCNNVGTMNADVFTMDEKLVGRHNLNFVVTSDSSIYLYDVDFTQRFKMEKGEYVVGDRYKYKIYSARVF